MWTNRPKWCSGQPGPLRISRTWVQISWPEVGYWLYWAAINGWERYVRAKKEAKWPGSCHVDIHLLLSCVAGIAGSILLQSVFSLLLYCILYWFVEFCFSLESQHTYQLTNESVSQPLSLARTRQNQLRPIPFHKLTLSKYAFRDWILKREKLMTVRLSCARSPTLQPHLGKRAEAKTSKFWPKIQSLILTSSAATFINRDVKSVVHEAWRFVLKQRHFLTSQQGWLVSWCFEPSKPLGIISGLSKVSNANY